MQQIKNNICLFVLISVLFVMGCNEPATTSEKNEMDTTSVVTNSDSSSMPAYDPAMEPLTVGAAFSKKLGDTLNIKMYELMLKPGDSAALHTHPDHTVYVLQGGKLAVNMQGKGRLVMDLKTGTGFISGPLSDAAKNIGNTRIKLLIADIYRQRGSGISSIPGYDPAMEPLTVGAAFSKKLYDTLNIKMYELMLKPGDSATLHTHPDHTVYVLQGGKLAVTMQGKGRLVMDLKTGTGFISGPLSDAAKNIGNSTIKLLVADIYRQRGSGISSIPGYDPAMEPLTVGAAFSKKLYDTLNIKMYELMLKPGDSATLHTHPDHTVYVLQGGKLAVTMQGKGRLVMDLKTGMGFISGPLSDAAKNIGNTTIKMLIADIYRPPGR